MSDIRDLFITLIPYREPWQDLLLLALWFGGIPPAAGLVAEDIVDEKIGQSLTAWIDRRFRGTLLAYLFRCKRCMSHWVVFTFWFAYLPVWLTLPFGLYTNTLVAIISLIVVIRYTRGWVEND
jgi:hypothetical protein